MDSHSKEEEHEEEGVCVLLSSPNTRTNFPLLNIIIIIQGWNLYVPSTKRGNSS